MEGQVQKCNMCVDRLEVGLKPACVSACLGNALNFGVIENAPERREQTSTEIPGFPTPDITHPNIRFELKRSLPDDDDAHGLAAHKIHPQGRTGATSPSSTSSAPRAGGTGTSRSSPRARIRWSPSRW